MASGFKDLANELKPREQMRRFASASDLRDEALLAILLRTGAPGCDVLELSRRLISAFGTLGEFVRADWRTMRARIKEYNRTHPDRRILGIGSVKQMELAAAFELMRRGYETKPDDVTRMHIGSGEDAVRVFRKVATMDDDKENFWVLPLDGRNHPLCEPIRLTRGTKDASVVDPSEAFREAIRWGASGIVIAHNHPSGNPEPSKEDVKITEGMIGISKVLSIRMLDHLVLGSPKSANGQGFVSIRDLAVLKF
jgi:DNA repair protein RadC